MKGLLSAAVLGVAVFAASLVVQDAIAPAPGAEPQPSVTAVELDADGLPPRIDYPGDLAYACDEQGRAVDIEPDTTEAWTAAQRGCERIHLALDRLPLPGGMRP